MEHLLLQVAAVAVNTPHTIPRRCLLLCSTQTLQAPDAGGCGRGCQDPPACASDGRGTLVEPGLCFVCRKTCCCHERQRTNHTIDGGRCSVVLASFPSLSSALPAPCRQHQQQQQTQLCRHQAAPRHPRQRAAGFSVMHQPTTPTALLWPSQPTLP